MGGQSIARWNHLDNLRWLAMIWGVFVHTLTLGEFGSLEVISSISHVFRMPLFFMVSGFLGAMLLSRRETATFIKDRIRSLCVPLAVGVIGLNIPTIWLMSLYTAMVDAPGAGAQPSWHLHLWFLVSLASFTVFAGVFNSQLLKVGHLMDNFSDSVGHLSHRPLYISLIIAFICELIILLSIAVMEKIIPLTWLIKATLSYLPFYVLGMFLFYAPSLRHSLSKINILVTLLAIIVFSGASLIDLPEGVSGPVKTLSLFLLRLVLCVMLMSIGEKILSWRNNFSIFVSQSIYTVYLVHYSIIYALGVVYVELFGPMQATGFWIISLSTIIIGFALHHLLVARVPLFAFLFNGREMRV